MGESDLIMTSPLTIGVSEPSPIALVLDTTMVMVVMAIERQRKYRSQLQSQQE